MSSENAFRSLAAILLLSILAGCGGSGGGAALPSAPKPTITVLSTQEKMLAGSREAILNATVSSSDTVSWTLAAGAPGSLSAATGASVNYLPPASVSAPVQAVVTASAGGSSTSFSFIIYPDPGPAGVSLIAGSVEETAVGADGKGSAARFVRPQQLAADWTGNIYVVEDITDYGGHVVGMQGLSLRKISPDGQVSTVIVDRNFARPAGIVSDRKGTLYIVERSPQAHMTNPYGGALYRLGADGSRSLVAGNPPGLAGNNATQVDGVGSAARFALPNLAGIDQDGNFYIVDGDLPAEAKVRKVTPEGVVSTVADVPGSVTIAPNGGWYEAKNNAVYQRVSRMPEQLVAGRPGVPGTVFGALPAGFGHIRAMAPLGPYSFAIISDNAVVKLILPH